MRRNIKNVVKYFTKTPRTLFLVDGMGAALTTFLMFFVLRRFYGHFGMPPHILTYLSVIGLAFCTCSTACFVLLKGSWPPFLIIISTANSIYCVLTVTLLFIYFNNLTVLGLSYFLVEIAVVAVIMYIELRVAIALKNKKTIVV